MPPSRHTGEKSKRLSALPSCQSMITWGRMQRRALRSAGLRCHGRGRKRARRAAPARNMDRITKNRRPKYHPTPLSGGDRKALAREKGRRDATARRRAQDRHARRRQGRSRRSVKPRRRPYVRPTAPRPKHGRSRWKAVAAPRSPHLPSPNASMADINGSKSNAIAARPARASRSTRSADRAIRRFGNLKQR